MWSISTDRLSVCVKSPDNSPAIEFANLPSMNSLRTRGEVSISVHNKLTPMMTHRIGLSILALWRLDLYLEPGRRYRYGVMRGSGYTNMVLEQVGNGQAPKANVRLHFKQLGKTNFFVFCLLFLRSTCAFVGPVVRMLNSTSTTRWCTRSKRPTTLAGTPTPFCQPMMMAYIPTK